MAKSALQLTADDRWEAVLHVPADAADLGLHRDENEASARFRRQLVDAIGPEAARRHGTAAERDFLLHRAALADSSAVWGGFVVTSSIDIDPSVTDPVALAAEAAKADPDVVMLALLVGITELPELPSAGIASPAAALSRLLHQRHGPGSASHILDYDGRPAAAAVRVEELDLGGRTIGGHTLPDDAPAAEHLVAEVHVLFPEADALATVTAATLHPPSLNHAVLAAGSIAGTVRVRTARDRM